MILRVIMPEHNDNGKVLELFDDIGANRLPCVGEHIVIKTYVNEEYERAVFKVKNVYHEYEQSASEGSLNMKKVVYVEVEPNFSHFRYWEQEHKEIQS
ncbi:hypothetical protein [Aureibacillus halotolerans]|uniref:Uncharacterized protein n=1 Tax=Aureibacillus halotolerans TaxID=1508390 RepID=A0A4R6TQS1_9BACI|nr:hypothetical protein [Aureibacillus halotolerans]TDQ35299.1 hypothetical protein EV213_12286 [Aureibacillus halotolerans]